MPGVSTAALPTMSGTTPPGLAKGDTASSGSENGTPFAAILSDQMGAAATLLPMLFGDGGIARQANAVEDRTGDGPGDAAALPLDLAALPTATPFVLPALTGAAEASAVRRTDPPRGMRPAEGLATAMQAIAGSEGDGLGQTVASTRDAGTSTPTNTAIPPAIVAGTDKMSVGQDIADLQVEPKSAEATRLANGLPDALPTVAAAVAPAHATAMGGTTELRIVTPLGSHPWQEAIGDSLVFMTNQQQQRAELVLTPPQLGRIEVSLTMSGDQANALFVSSNPAVRDALESALPRLREILADAGIVLNSQVGSELPGSSGNAGGSDDGSWRGPAVARDHGMAGAMVGAVAGGAGWTTVPKRGLVDVFA